MFMYVIDYVSKEFCINRVGSLLELGLAWLILEVNKLFVNVFP